MAVTQLFRLVVCRSAARATLRVHRRYSQVCSALSERLRVFESLREKQGNKSQAEAAETRLSIQLADGRTVKATAGVTTPLFIAQSSRVKGALVSKVNGELWELGRPLEVDCELQLLGFDTDEGRQAAWRTGACVLSGVLQTVFGAEVCREGASELGLYCDHLLENSALSLSDVEEKCKQAAALKLPLTRLELNTEEVRELFQNSKLRLQLVEEQMSGPTVTVYRCGDSLAVCDGPLLPHTGLLKVFKTLQWDTCRVGGMSLVCIDPGRGRSFHSGHPLGRKYLQQDVVFVRGQFPVLSRYKHTAIYQTCCHSHGVAFPGEKDKEEWEREREEARRRDHRRIGTDQDLFFFNDVSPGSCFFLPKGAYIYNTLTDFIKSEYRRRGFNEVVTPTLYSTALWERSGHWEHYSEQMFTVTSEGSQTYALKPMNCPAHCVMFEQRVRSWRELPLRWADFGALHRNELSGALAGLTRVRRFCQDDAHIFCTPDQ
ncbi:probable threonine--tRNA ligase 2, cytoplasmic, partial [Notothenia coriiceps]|uniref:threonine--tRNA ligase n=1 Tax=Notothenia coriiceps TaxID=8208 RepID=A0A6I9NTB5_9TELE